MKKLKYIAFVMIISLLYITKVNANSIVLGTNDISFNGAWGSNFYINHDPNLNYQIQIGVGYSGNEIYNTLVLDVCSGIDLTKSTDLFRTNKIGSACSTSCFGNTIIRTQLPTTCVASTGQTGNSFRIYIPVVKWDYGAGCGQTGCHPSLDDKITFHSRWTYGTFSEINGAYLTTDEVDVEGYKNTETIDNSITSLKNQQHQDNTNINNSINNMNNNITDSNIDNANTSASEWASKNLSDNVVSQMVTMPITLLNSYINGMGSTCQPYNLGSLFGHNITFPCIDLATQLGALWNIIDVLFSGLMIYAIGKKFVKIFNDFTNLKDNQVDELYGGGI